MIAIAPRTPVIGAEGQFKGHEAEWRQANVRNMPYLEYVPKALEGQPIPAPARQQFEPPIRALAEALKLSDNDLKSVIGFYDASLGERGPDESGKAIMARQKQGETGNINFLDNYVRALWHAGRIYLDLIPHVYDTARTLHIIREDDQQGQVTLNQEYEEQGVKRLYQMGVGRYNIEIDVGGTWQNRRQEAVASMMQLIHAAPEMVPLIGDLMVGEMDWPGSSAIAARLKKMLPPNLQDDDQNKAIPPQVQAKIAQLTDMVEKQHSLLGQQKQMLDSKQMEITAKSRDLQAKLESDERREVMRANAGIAEAALKADNEKASTLFEAAAQRLSESMEHLKDLHMQMNDQAHEKDLALHSAAVGAATQAQDQQHEAGQAQADREHATELASTPPPVDPNAHATGGANAGT